MKLYDYLFIILTALIVIWAMPNPKDPNNYSKELKELNDTLSPLAAKINTQEQIDIDLTQITNELSDIKEYNIRIFDRVSKLN